MGKSIQVAFQIPSDELAAIDDLVPAEFPSRAEVLREAIRSWLRDRREKAIDAALAEGYAAEPPGETEDAWAELSIEGLKDADLDW